jgi:LysM repeat protein
MQGGRRRSVARLLAPLALLLAVAAVLLVVQSTNKSGDSKGDSSSKGKTAQTTTTDSKQKPRRVRPTYTVKLNDTLGLISEKTGVSVARIETLNPDLDPQNLIVGQRIKLKE